MPEKRDKKLDGRGCSTGRDRNIFDHTGLKPAVRTGTDEETVKRKQKRKQATENRRGNRKKVTAKRQKKIRKEKRRTTNETHIKTGTFHALS